jgi:CHASE2 domain-containing sensor protein
LRLESRFPIALRSVAFGTGCALFAAACMWLPPLTLLDESLFDVCFQLRGVRRTDVRDKIVLIGIDDDFVRELNKPLAFISPELGEMVKILHKEGARAVGIDLFVPGDLNNLTEMQPGGKGSAATLKEQIREFDNVVVIERVLGDRAEKPLPEWYARRLPERKPGELPTNLASAELMEDPDFLVRRQRLIAAAPRRLSAVPI